MFWQPSKLNGPFRKPPKSPLPLWEGIHPVKYELFETTNLKFINRHMEHGYPKPPYLTGLRGGGKWLKLLIKFLTFSPPPSPSPIEGGGEFAWDRSCFEWFIEMPHLLNVTKKLYHCRVTGGFEKGTIMIFNLHNITLCFFWEGFRPLFKITHPPIVGSKR